MIALACIYIASVLKDKDTTAWFEELRVDMNVVCLHPSVDCFPLFAYTGLVFEHMLVLLPGFLVFLEVCHDVSCFVGVDA